MLARSLGVVQLIVALNKMEKCDYSEERFNELREIIGPYLLKKGFKQKDIYFVPMSAITD